MVWWGRVGYGRAGFFLGRTGPSQRLTQSLAQTDRGTALRSAGVTVHSFKA